MMRHLKIAQVYEVGLEFEVWSLIFSLFRSSKVELSIGCD